MSRDKYPLTPAVHLLRQKQIPFSAHLYPYVDHGGTFHAAECLRVAEYGVIKTLVMETELKNPLLMLMHGDQEVSTRQLARVLGVKTITPCSPATAHRLTGYEVGGISPFGTRTALPVYAQTTIFELPHITINGGKRGFLVEIDPAALRTVLSAQEVDVTRQDV